MKKKANKSKAKLKTKALRVCCNEKQLEQFHAHAEKLGVVSTSSWALTALLEEMSRG